MVARPFTTRTVVGMAGPRAKILDAPAVVLVTVAVTLSALAGFAWFKLYDASAPGGDCARATGKLRILIASSVPPEPDALDSWASIDAKVAELRSACPADTASAFLEQEYQGWVSGGQAPAPNPPATPPAGTTLLTPTTAPQP